VLPVRKRPAVLATEGHRFSLGCPGVSCDAFEQCRCFLTMDGSYLSHVLLAVSVAADNQCGSDCRRGGGGGGPPNQSQSRYIVSVLDPSALAVVKKICMDLRARYRGRE